jgi:hypothetical protein
MIREQIGCKMGHTTLQKSGELPAMRDALLRDALLYDEGDTGHKQI